jgi:L-aspartate oxidase
MANTPEAVDVPEKGRWKVPQLVDRGAAQVAADDIRSVMWEYAGIARTAKGLRTCLRTLDEITARLPVGATEEHNLVETARLIAEAALLRRESRGGHFRSDFPKAKRKWQGRHIEW